MAMRSIAQRLRIALAGFSLLAIGALFLFVMLDFDSYFETHYGKSKGLLYELIDHGLLPIAVLIVPLLIAAPTMINRAMSPLRRAAEVVSSASGNDRGFRVDLAELPKEAMPFASAVNDLLERLDSAAEATEHFASDVAHELKLPLAILSLELDRFGEAAQPLRAEVNGMTRLIDQLLLLARLEADAVAHLRHDEVDLAEVASEVTAQFAPAATRDGKVLSLEAEDAPIVMGRREAIAAALRNLVENGLRATPAGSTVKVIVGGGPKIVVRDEGEGLSPERLRLLSSRFARSEHASPAGAGLGLAIVSKIMAAHHGRLEADDRLREVRLIFPLKSRPSLRIAAKAPDPISGAHAPPRWQPMRKGPAAG